MNALSIYPLCEALATGLFHSLWLFSLLAGVSWLVGTQLNQSRHRYRLHLITLLTCLGSFLFMVGRQWWSVTRMVERVAKLEGELSSPVTIEIITNFEQFGIAGTTDWTVYVVVLYTAGLLAMLIRYGMRYAGTLRMRKGGLLPTPELRTLFQQIRSEVHPGSTVSWRITDRVREVLVVGVLRPVILFPVGLVNQLSTDEVTAILRHELTHLRRHDPFWNAVQEMIRALFFYHPAVHWLCAELDREREYACDDAVLLQTQPSIYARALLRVANYSLNPSNPLTMAAADTSNLSLRVKRLFSPTAPRPSLLGRANFLPSLAMLPLLLLLTYALATPYQLGAQTADDVAPARQEVIIKGTVHDADTGKPLIGTSVYLPNGKTGTVTDINGNYELTAPNGNVVINYSYAGYKSADIQYLTEHDENTIDIGMFKDKNANVIFGGSGERSSVTRLESEIAEDANIERASPNAADDVVISGTVTDGKTGKPLIGTSIVVPDTKIGAITDFDGNYSIRLPKGKDQLIVSYVGYKTVHFTSYPFKTSTINIQLFSDKDADLQVEGGDANIILMVDSERDYGNPDALDSDGQTDDGASLLEDVRDKVAFFINGKRISGNGFGKVDPDSIVSVSVFKERSKLDELGVEQELDGAILITTKE